MTPAVRHLDVATIADLAVGSAVLGTGGGGDPHIGMLITVEAIDAWGPVEVIAPDDLDDDDVVIVVSMSGAPTVMTEKIPNGGEMQRVIDLTIEHAGRQPRAMLSFEIGGINSLFPVAAAAMRRLPLVDADGMGRAFPEFQITAFNAAGVTFGPRFVTDEKGNVLRIDGIDATWLERINRRALVAMGGSVMSAIGMRGRDVKRGSIHGSISLAVAIGRALRLARDDTRSWFDALGDITTIYHLFSGKVISVERRVDGGWVRGHAELVGLGDQRERAVRIDFQNEHLVARARTGDDYSDVLATTPDLIAVLDTETGMPITTEGLRYGQRATVVGMPCEAIWRTRRGLALAGPRYFCWDIDYVPLEERIARRHNGQARPSMRRE
jgi:DUF917 family protein